MAHTWGTSWSPLCRGPCWGGPALSAHVLHGSRSETSLFTLQSAFCDAGGPCSSPLSLPIIVVQLPLSLPSRKVTQVEPQGVGCGLLHPDCSVVSSPDLLAAFSGPTIVLMMRPSRLPRSPVSMASESQSQFYLTPASFKFPVEVNQEDTPSCRLEQRGSPRGGKLTGVGVLWEELFGKAV